MWPPLLLLACTPAPDTGGPAPADTAADCIPGEVSEQHGIAMVHLCPGSFTMGSPEDEVGRQEDEPPRQVTLSRAFYLSQTETTVGEYRRLVGDPFHEIEGCDDALCSIHYINWHQSAELANALSDEAGLEPCYQCIWGDGWVDCAFDERWESPYTCPGYRLPTEAEWEYAARAGTTSAFPTGGDLLPGDEYDCEEGLVLDDGTPLGDIAEYCGSWGARAEEGIFEVAQRQPNPWGLYDMHGGRAEWCHDLYAFDPGGDATDPWTTEGAHHIARGGSFANTPAHIRSAEREWIHPNPFLRTARLARTE